jgi:hypothetical protein
VRVGETEQRFRNSLKSANFRILEPIQMGVNHKVVTRRLIIRAKQR